MMSRKIVLVRIKLSHVLGTVWKCIDELLKDDLLEARRQESVAESVEARKNDVFDVLTNLLVAAPFRNIHELDEVPKEVRVLILKGYFPIVCLTEVAEHAFREALRFVDK